MKDKKTEDKKEAESRETRGMKAAPAVMQEHVAVFRDGRAETCREPVLTEYSLEVAIGKNVTGEKRKISLVCTPEYLEELVLGRLLTEGIIKGTDDVKKLSISGESDGAAGKAHVILRDEVPAGGGAADARQSVIPVSWKPEWIFDLADCFHRGMPLHDRTWGTHSCFLSSGGRILFQCEDIGRHNAVDKAVGFGLKAGIDLSSCILYSSGRIPSDMAVKAVRAGIPVLAAKAVPTREAVRLAEACGLTLIGGARRDSMKVYADGRRKLSADGTEPYANLHFLTKKS